MKQRSVLFLLAMTAFLCAACSSKPAITSADPNRPLDHGLEFTELTDEGRVHLATGKRTQENLGRTYRSMGPGLPVGAAVDVDSVLEIHTVDGKMDIWPSKVAQMITNLHVAHERSIQAITGEGDAPGALVQFENALKAVEGALEPESNWDVEPMYLKMEAALRRPGGEDPLAIFLPGYSIREDPAKQTLSNSANVRDSGKDLVDHYKNELSRLKEIVALQSEGLRVLLLGKSLSGQTLILSGDTGGLKGLVEIPLALQGHMPQGFTGSFEEGRLLPIANPPMPVLREAWNAPSTHIDLPSIGAVAGDRIELRAYPIQGSGDSQVELPESVATFVVDEFGWHSRFVPYAMLVAPTELKEKKEEEFELAASLAWLHRYRPRPEDNSDSARFLRMLEPSIGLHTALLDFDPDLSAEIGLGVTLGFFEDKLLVGYGWNFMAETNNGGRYVYFGSDLISLLGDREKDGAGK